MDPSMKLAYERQQAGADAAHKAVYGDDTRESGDAYDEDALRAENARLREALVGCEGRLAEMGLWVADLPEGQTRRVLTRIQGEALTMARAALEKAGVV